MAAVGVIGGYLPVVHHRGIQQREGMRAAPPSGRIGGIAAVRCPAIARVFVQAEVFGDVLRVAHALENAHVPAAGKHVGPLYAGVYGKHMARHVFGLVQLAFGKLVGLRRGKVAPDQRRAGDGRRLAHGNAGQIHDIEKALQIPFALCFRGRVVVKHVQGVVLRVLRVDAVTGKTAAQTVGALVHGGDGFGDFAAVDLTPFCGNHAGDGAARRDAYLAFNLLFLHFTITNHANIRDLPRKKYDKRIINPHNPASQVNFAALMLIAGKKI